jgi:hypothetical protein
MGHDRHFGNVLDESGLHSTPDISRRCSETTFKATSALPGAQPGTSRTSNHCNAPFVIPRRVVGDTPPFAALTL